MLKPENKHSVKISEKTVDSFIKYDYEEPVKNFFLKDIDKLLSDYKLGLPENKPEVLKQTEELKIKREKMKKDVETEFLNADTGIRIEQNGQHKSLTRKEIVDLLKVQQQQLKALSENQNPIKIAFHSPNGEKKELSVKELVDLAQKQFNTIMVQNQLINQLRDQIKRLEN